MGKQVRFSTGRWGGRGRQRVREGRWSGRLVLACASNGREVQQGRG